MMIASLARSQSEPPSPASPAAKPGTWLSEPTGLDEKWQTLGDILSPKRKWSTQFNTTEAEQRANIAVLEAITEAMTHENPAQEIGELIRVAQTAGAQAFHPDKRGVVGKYQLQGPNMTVDALLTLVPIDRWPAVGGSGCFDIDCTRGCVPDMDLEQRIHCLIHEQKMRDGECAMIMGLARLLNVHVYTLENSGYFDAYAEL
jgi:hypothetical protein